MKNIKHQQAGTFAFYLSLLSLLFFFMFGCNESLQSTNAHFNAAPRDKLLDQATQILEEGLSDKDPRVRANAIEVVAATKQIRLMPKVKRLLIDQFVPVRFLAALAIGDLEYRLAEKSVKQLLKAPDENTKIAAAYAMSKLGSTDSTKLIYKAITSKDQIVRANAALLLGKIGNKDALEVLRWAQQDLNSDDWVKFQVLEARARLGDEQVLRKLWAIVLSAYADDRKMGIIAMGALGTPKAKDILVTKLDDKVLEVRLAAAEQLGMLGSNTGEPEVLDVFTKKLTAGLDEQARERVNILTALAIGQICTENLREFLPQLLKDRSKFVRIAAAKAVFQCIKND